MKAIVNFEIGGVRYTFEITEQQDMESLHRAIALSNPPRVCNLCKGTDVSLISTKDTEGNVYVNVRCGNCTAQAKLGQYKAGGFFWHQFKEYKYGKTLLDQETEYQTKKGGQR